MNNQKTIKALGFIEVIIAIVVVGIASAVFLTMSGRAMKELVQTERIEYMARISRDGVTIAQELANKEKNEPDSINWFPDTDTGGTDPLCYLIKINTESSSDYVFDYNGNLVTGFTYKEFSYNESGRDSIISRLESLDPNEIIYENYFLAMCITDIDENQQWANVYFWVGDIGVKGDITSDSDVRDLKYYSIIDI